MIGITQNSERMAELLRKGYTMLNLACPICNNPIFKKKNQPPFCPICNREVQIVDQNTISNKKNASPYNIQIETVNTEFKSNLTLNIEQLSNIINKKMEWLIKLISEETQLEKLEKQLHLIKKSLKILQEIKSLTKSA